MQEFGNFIRHTNKMPEGDIKKLLLADMKQSGLDFHDIDMVFNHPSEVEDPETGLMMPCFISCWKAAL